MAVIKPFKAVRPVRDKVHLVASRSYINYSWQALHRKLNENPYTFIHVINPQYKLSNKYPPNSSGRFREVRNRYEEFKKKGIFKQESRNAFYIYRQQKGEHTWTGIMGCASAMDYDREVIKKHEKTLEKREKVFTNYLHLTRINAEPVLMTYPDDREINNTLRGYMGRFPEYDYTTMDKVRHTLWILDDKDVINYIKERFSGFNSLYIADGHHRSASSARLARELRAEENGSANALYNYFLSFFIPESALEIFPFHRLVSGIDSWDEQTLISRLEKDFHVEKKSFPEVPEPDKLHQIALVTRENYYLLTPGTGTFDKDDPVQSLDVSILAKNILSPLLGINDQRKDKRIDFLGGESKGHEVCKLVRKGKYQAGFLLHPVTLSQLKSVANNGYTMPPKSTFIEPKLRSGLTIFEF